MGIIVAIIAGLCLSLITGTIVWLLWNTFIAGTFGLPVITWTFTVAASWIINLLFDSTSSKD
jgi:hypothetical protein